MTIIERLKYQVNTEIDMYINLLQEDVIQEPKTRAFILDTVIPRFNKMREIFIKYDDTERRAEGTPREEPSVHKD